MSPCEVSVFQHMVLFSLAFLVSCVFGECEVKSLVARTRQEFSVKLVFFFLSSLTKVQALLSCHCYVGMVKKSSEETHTLVRCW